MRIERMAVAGLTACVIGCGDGGGSAEEPTIFGEWSASGDAAELFTPAGSVWTRGIEIREDGSGSVLLENWQIGALDRVPVIWSHAQSENAEHSLVMQSLSLGQAWLDYRFESNGEMLVFSDGTREYEFLRDSPAVDNPLREAMLTEIEPVLSSPIHPMTGLVRRGDTSWFEIYGNKLVDLDGTILSTDAVYSHPLAAQDGDLWMACSPCESPATIQRRTIGGALVSQLDLSARIHTRIEAGYFDGASLWLLTDTTDPGDTDPHAELWRFDPAAAITAQSAEVRSLPLAIDAFTFHEGRLFLVISMPSQVLVELGTTETHSWELPDGVRWQGLASDGESLQILGAGDNEYPVISFVTNT